MKEPPWLLVPPETLEEGGEIPLEPGEARHVAGPLRRTVGDDVVLTDGRGTIAPARLVRVDRSGVTVRVEAPVRQYPAVDGPTVALGVLDSRAMDWAVQKAVEVGVRRFVPVICRRSQASVRRAALRSDHWRRIARQALKQCHRAWEMTIETPIPIDSVVGGDLGTGLIADPSGPDLFKGPVNGAATLIVGPEGGLTPEEIDGLQSAGWSPASLGKFVLRAETALVVGAAFLAAVCRRDAERGTVPTHDR